MRVAAITPNYPPASRVGAWLATHEYLAELACRGHEVSAYALGGRRAYVHEGVQVHGGATADPLDLARGADVVVGHSGDHGAAADAARTAGRPLVQFAHGGDDGPASNAEVVVVNARSNVERMGLEADHRVIVCRPVTRRGAHFVPHRGDKITLVNLSKAKGVKTLWQVSERLPDHGFLGVRGGHGEQHVPRPRNWAYSPPVPDMRRIWGQTRVLAVPSRYETWGMVGVEACVSGIPVVASDLPGLRESLGDAAVFVDRDDVDGWAEALTALDDPDTYAAASERAKARFADLETIFAADLDRFVTAVEAIA